MNILIIDKNIHHKNRIGLIMMLDYLKQERNGNLAYVFGDISYLRNTSVYWNVVISPAIPCNTSEFPDTKFIFGPHFSVFPNRMLNFLSNRVNNNSVYIQPSKWAMDIWKSMGVETVIPVKTQPFPVDVGRFNSIQTHDDTKTHVFIYFKRRRPSELQILENTLREKKIDYKVFDYVKQYEENDYLEYLKKAKYGIVLDAHESQGFAIQEALSCNVPLLVWNATTMAQEEGINYPEYPATSIPYWNECCGEVFTDWVNEFDVVFEKFQRGIQERKYNPRDYIINELGVANCANKLVKLINSI